MMAKGLRRLAGDAPLRERLGKAARVYAERHLDVAAVTVAAPLTLAIALGVKLSSPGPVLFRQRRHGLSGKVVGVWKFRGMGVQEDGDEIPQTRRADPRVTRFGAFLRRTSLDELPQFFNVLQGHISVVGPRPHAVAHNER
ncbi:MAG: sugar transferase [Betaproteobacteria bacterium]|nr:sugar transferase [Betaproteobacteria bacterium]